MSRVFAFLLIAVAGFCGPAANAGAWARAPGEVFLSFSSNLVTSADGLTTGTIQVDPYHSFYGEIGLGRRLTFGLDIGQGEYTREYMGFLRYTLTRPESRLQVAFDLGMGQRHVDVLGRNQLARVGVSFGYGFGSDLPNWMPLDFSGGWMSLEAVAIQDLTAQNTRWKAEATLGLNATDRLHVLMQLMAEEWPGADVSYEVNPSIVYDVFDGTSIEVGLRSTVNGERRVGLELGLWHQF